MNDIVRAEMVHFARGLPHGEIRERITEQQRHLYLLRRSVADAEDLLAIYRRELSRRG